MLDQEVCRLFNQLRWHDSKLRSFAVVRNEDRDDVVFELELQGLGTIEFTPVTLTLIDSTYMKADVDLDGKFQCGDDISSADCSIESDLKKELLQTALKYTPEALDAYYLFDFYLIPPGGRIQVFASNYLLKEKQLAT